MAHRSTYLAFPRETMTDFVGRIFVKQKLCNIGEAGFSYAIFVHAVAPEDAGC
jgi:hypothetical protein